MWDCDGYMEREATKAMGNVGLQQGVCYYYRWRECGTTIGTGSVGLQHVQGVWGYSSYRERGTTTGSQSVGPRRVEGVLEYSS